MNEPLECDTTSEELAGARRYSLVIAWSAEDDAYLVRVPEFPGLLTHGATRGEAVATGEEAIATWPAGLHHFGHPFPPPPLAAAGVP